MSRGLRLFSRRTMSGRSYNDAIDALNTLQTPHYLIKERQRLGIRPDAGTLRDMESYIRRIGYTLEDLNRLNIIHVAGTKGKGSTCAYVDAILRRHGAVHGAPRRVGLFTSPHLIAVRERIRIDGAPISEADFARAFFEVWDRLEATAPPAPPTPPTPTTTTTTALHTFEMHGKPLYARYLTLLAFHVFLSTTQPAPLSCAVIETGVGGAFDATNVVPRPLATGITTLGLDHEAVLGATVEQIAWHKAGIMKPGVPALAVEQPAAPAAAAVLAARARERAAPAAIELVSEDARLAGVRVRPDAPWQRRNASLAIRLAELALVRLDARFVGPGGDGEVGLSPEFVDGLEKVVWRGRCEVKEEGRVVWLVDGAHTADSLQAAASWFVQEAASRTGPKVLIFNQQGRSAAVDFLQGIHDTVTAAAADGAAFQHVIFCTNVTYAATGYKRDFVNHLHDPKEVEQMTAQRAFAERWKALDPHADVAVVPTIEEAINQVRRLSGALADGGDQTVQAFVTGSLHLVGGVLGLLDKASAL